MSALEAIIKTKKKFKKTLCLLLATSLISISSCARLDYDSNSIPKKRDEALLEYYNYPRQIISMDNTLFDETEKYVVKKIKFDSAINLFGNKKISIDYYEQKENGKFPTILVLPITGGVDSSVKCFSEYFASNGFNCAIVYNRYIKLNNIKNSDELEKSFKQSIFDNRQVLDYLVNEEKVDKNKLGSFGISLGGIKAAITAGVDKRLKCNIIVLGGGSIADILCSSDENRIKDFRENFLKNGSTLEEIYSEFSDKIRSDPIKLAPYIDAENVLMYIALFDKSIPKKCGTKLREALGKPETIYLFSGHYSSLLYRWYAKRASLEFFKEKLK